MAFLITMAPGAAFAFVVIGALLLDLIAGDPPTAWHPVGWMGRYIAHFQPVGGSAGRQFFAGLLVVSSGVLITGVVAFLFQRLLVWSILSRRAVLYIPVLAAGAAVAKGSFAFRSLIESARHVREALEVRDTDRARHLLSHHLVSRSVAGLPDEALTSACIESLAENFTDSVAAPLFYFGLTGFPGAWIYRFVDTADSMLGYRDAKREWYGKTAARLDDFLCFIPARLVGWLLVAAAAVAGLNARGARRVMCRDAGNCSSPNSGWAMAAAAGALGVRLEKRGAYVINDGGKSPRAADVTAAIRLLRLALAIWIPVVLTLTFTVLPLRFRRR